MKFLLFLALLPACLGASAQPAYPSRPITIIVPFGPGGVADITARTVGQAMAASLKQPVVIDNRPSAGAIIGSAAVAGRLITSDEPHCTCVVNGVVAP